MAGRRIKRIGVVGAGTMGRGIAQVFCLHGMGVVLMDRKKTILTRALSGIKAHTAPELWEMVLSGIETTTSLTDLKGCDIVIEAATEDMSLKKSVLKSLDGLLKKDTIMATNTSSLSVDELAGVVSNPARFAGMHFMNPPKSMELVEVVRGEKTSGETIALIKDLARKLGKTPVVVNDSPGFVTNRLLFAMIGEALGLLEKKAACKTAIDRIMRHGMNHPMGPIELADFIGLDICEKIMDNLYNGLGDERYRPPAILRNLVRRGKLGVKSGEGFYKYPKK